MENKTYTVSEINSYIDNKLKFDPNLKNILIKGELSNYKDSYMGHSYFTLKDENSQIDCVMFKGNKDRFLKFKPENGMNLIIKGKVEVYKKTGKYQFYATRITEDGLGNLHIAFEQLKKKLSKNGLFDSACKKNIPKYPRKIGVVTAQNGAAIRDIITTIKRRYPICEILLFSTLVQGKQAASEIVKQIRYAQKFDIDTLIIGRGGGSIEDLWPFNEEIVAYEVYKCEIPIISAVGHETDFTIIDFVSDLRAPTPTAAAELAVPELNKIKDTVNQLKYKAEKNINEKISMNKTKLEHICKKNIFKHPESIYEIKGMNLDNLIVKLDWTSKNIIVQNKNKLFRLENSYVLKNPEEIIKKKTDDFIKNINKLEVLNPLLTLKRGYSIAKSNNKVISSINDVEIGDEVDIELNDGVINTKVI